MRYMKYSGLLLLALFFLPLSASATTKFEVGGWVPYWTEATGTADVMPHLNELTSISPFVYTVGASGNIIDNAPMSAPQWQQLVAQAKADKVLVVPTISWSNGAQEDAILSNTTKRIALENSIAALAKQNGYDGIDIDFENKLAQDETYFSTFLKGLYARMGPKWVYCDIEARTPIADEYYGEDVPTGAGQYANDYTQINKYCDRVRLMTYDQQGIDLQLSDQAASSSELYGPVADPSWDEAVINLAEKSIAPSKIEIGIPTYGYEYDVTAYASNEYVYNILWTFDPRYASQIEQQYNVAASRAPWGEEELTYVPNQSATTTAPSSAAPTSTLPSLSALSAAAAASLYANSFNSHLDFRYLVWSDAQAVQEKVQLAQELGVRGVAIFEFDGGEDPGIWGVLQGVKK